VKQPDIVAEELHKLGFEVDDQTARMLDTALYRAMLTKLIDEIEALREEVQIWTDRFEAERQDHEATMKAWDAERSGL